MTRILCWCGLGMAWLVAGASLAGQSLQYQLRSLTIDDGLAHSDATCVAADPEGFIWIGTYQGLDRYDGYEIKSFFDQDTSILSAYNNRINDLDVDNQDRIWLATQKGVSCFSTAAERYLELEWPAVEEARVRNKGVAKILYHDPTDLLILGDEAGLEIFSCGPDRKLTYRGISRSQVVGSVFGMAIDAQDRLWLLSANGLFCQPLRGGRLPDLRRVPLTTAAGEPVTSSTGLLLHDGALWIGGGSQLIRAPLPTGLPERLTVRTYPLTYATLPRSQRLWPDDLVVSSLAVGRNGDIWVGSQQGLWRGERDTDGFRLHFFDPEDHLVGTGPNALPVSDLFVGRNGTLWAATYGGGVKYLDLDARPFHTLRRQPGRDNTLAGNYIRAILEDREGRLWIGTRGNGLDVMDLATGRIENYRAGSSGLAGNNVYCLLESRDGTVWIGTSAGVNVHRPPDQAWETLPVGLGRDDALSQQTIFSLAEDKFGQIWAGSWQRGLNRIQRLGAGRYRVQQLFRDGEAIRLSSNKITFVYCDTLRNEVLVGTDNGLNQLFLDQRGEVTSVRYYFARGGGEGLASNYVWPIQRTPDGTIWVGTLGGGLTKIVLNAEQGSEVRMTTYGKAAGNPSRDVESLLLDKRGRLWLGGTGLTCFDPTTESFTSFTAADGLQSNSFKIGSAARGRGGRLYFGGINGLNYFDPDAVLRVDSGRYRLAFTGLVVNQREIVPYARGERWVLLPRSINRTEKIRLSHLENNFRLSFSAFNYQRPGKTRYRYRLLGDQETWIETRENKASYSNLEFGEYVFQAMVADEDGTWRSDPIEMSIEIVAPWWLSRSAKVCYFLLVLAILLAVYYYLRRWYRLKKNYEFTRLQEQQSEELHRMRLQFFTNISHEFRTPLTLILNPLTELLSGGVPARHQHRYLRSMERNARRLLELINELMDFRKAETGAYELRTERGNLNAFAAEVCEQFREHALQRRVELDFTAAGFVEDLWFERKGIEKVLVNLLSNAFAHTPAGGRIGLSILDRLPPADRLPGGHYRIDSDLPSAETDFVWLCVSDSGCGIDAAELPRVFDRYYQMQAHQAYAPGGTGVGLAMVKSIVGLHHGRIELYSEPAGGSVFLVGLPKGRAHLKNEEVVTTTSRKTTAVPRQLTTEQAETKTLPRPGAAHLQRVLFVEDNAELRGFIADYLGSKYDLLVARDGQEALELVEKKSPELIISDLMMPRLDGLQLCKALRSESTTRHIPLVLLTAKSSVENRLEGIGSGADYYLTKPFDVRELELIVANLLRQRSEQREHILDRSFQIAKQTAVKNEDEDFVRSVVELIESHMDRTDFDVDYLSRAAGMSRTKLYRRIKKATDMSVGELIRKQRLHRAVELLTRENYTVMEVMYRIGIQSQSHFTKLFKKEFRVTPTEFVAGLRD